MLATADSYAKMHDVFEMLSDKLLKHRKPVKEKRTFKKLSFDAIPYQLIELAFNLSPNN